MLRGRKNGFTLVEVMVALFLMTTVMGAIYGVWFRVTREVSKSNTRQALQNELRKAGMTLSADLKAIKEGTLEIPPDKQSEDCSSMWIKFERFQQTKDGKIAQDSTEEVIYSLNNGIFSKKSASGTKIFSANMTAALIERSIAAGSELPALEETNKNFKEGRKAVLDIELVGMKKVPGIGSDMYHAERTSVVMRDEYYKNINKTYKSNFELAKLAKDDVVRKDLSDDSEARFKLGAELSMETLMKMDKDELEGLEKVQEDMLKQAEETLDSINENVDAIDDGRGFWSSLGDNLDFLDLFGESDGEKVSQWKKDMKKAESKDDLEKVMKEVNGFADKKEEKFFSESYSGFSSLPKDNGKLDKDSEEFKLFKEAYDLALQDRSLEAMKKSAEENEEEVEETETNKDRIFKEGKQTFTVDDGKGGTTTVQESQEAYDKRMALKKVYEKIDLEWMGDVGKESEEVKAYNAVKFLQMQGQTKLDVIDYRDITKSNLEKIGQALAKK